MLHAPLVRDERWLGVRPGLSKLMSLETDAQKWSKKRKS